MCNSNLKDVWLVLTPELYLEGEDVASRNTMWMARIGAIGKLAKSKSLNPKSLNRLTSKPSPLNPKFPKP